MKRAGVPFLGALVLASLVSMGCAGPGSGAHVSPMGGSQPKSGQVLVKEYTPDCDPDTGCSIIPCDSCTIAVPVLYDAYYLQSGGGGGVGGADHPPIPPPLIGTPKGCDADESLCYLIPGDDTNVLYYSSGQGGIYTVDPAGCRNTGTGFVSSTDGKTCSTWQVYFYDAEYIGQTPNPPPPSLPGVVDAISVGLSTANVGSGSFGSPQVLNGGHLYVAYWSNHIPVVTRPLLQAGNIADKIRFAKFTQNVLADPHFYFSLARAQALSLSHTLDYKKDQYGAHTPGDLAPAYIPASQNSNTWAAALLLSSGVSQGTIDQFVDHLSGATLYARYPYGYGAGNTLVNFF